MSPREPVVDVATAHLTSPHSISRLLASHDLHHEPALAARLVFWKTNEPVSRTLNVALVLAAWTLAWRLGAQCAAIQ